MEKLELISYCMENGIAVESGKGREELIADIYRSDLEKKNKAELTAICEEKGYSVPSSMKKGEIIDALIDVLLSEPAPEEPEEEKAPFYEEVIPERPGFPDGLSEDMASGKEPEMPEEKPEEKVEAPAVDAGMSEKELKKAADEMLRASNKKSKRQELREAAKEARAERRANIARVNDATTTVSGDIESRAYGEDGSLSPRQLRNAPRSLSINGERLNYLTPAEEDDLDLTESYNNAAYIPRGIVTKTTPPRTIRMKDPATGEEKNCVNVSAIVEYGTRMVYIPAKYFFEDYFQMDQTKIRQFMQGRIGSEIDFRVVHIDRTDPKNPVYTGSRIAAMRKKRCDFWYSERQKGRSLIQPGSVQQARVVAVSERLVFVEIFGAEIRVDPSEIAYEYVVDARNYYVPGDEVLVKIKSATLKDRAEAAALGYPVECSVSLKAVYDDPKQQYIKNQMWGASFSGVVSNITIGANNVVNFFVNDGKIDILCHLQKGITKMPQRGDTVVGKITGMDENTGNVWGIIQHINPNRFERRARAESFVNRR